MSRDKVIVVVSGGMDSVTLAHVVHEHHDVELVSFDYGQRHRKEIEFAARCAARLESPHHVVDLRNITNLISRSVLTDHTRDVPDGHYAENTMRQTVVPNRNAIMMNIAAGYAITAGASAVATGVHAGDHYIYPDCRPEFIGALDKMLNLANEGFVPPTFRVMAPFVTSTKGDIVRRGAALDVPFVETWSCYKGGDVHCGACGTCFERREAFTEAGVTDPTEYLATPDYADPR